ncbi:SMP-30/gluconolactonase/LRE family protein [Sphingomonas sp. MMS24-JH45]
MLWFVDIEGAAGPSARSAERHHEGLGCARAVGWVVPAEGGGLLAGLQTGLARFDPDSGTFAHLTAVEPDVPGNRLNDCTVAPDGSIWFGSMDDGERQATGRVHRWDGQAVETSAIAAVAITNGPGVTPDGATLYHVDTAGGVIHAVALPGDGTTGAVRTFAIIDPSDGHPDGVTVDFGRQRLGRAVGRRGRAALRSRRQNPHGSAAARRQRHQGGAGRRRRAHRLCHQRARRPAPKRWPRSRRRATSSPSASTRRAAPAPRASRCERLTHRRRTTRGWDQAVGAASSAGQHPQLVDHRILAVRGDRHRRARASLRPATRGWHSRSSRSDRRAGRDARCVRCAGRRPRSSSHDRRPPPPP